MLNAEATIEIQYAGSISIAAEGDDDFEVLFTEVGGRDGARNSLGHDHTAPVVQRFVGKFYLVNLYVGTCSVDRKYV